MRYCLLFCLALAAPACWCDTLQTVGLPKTSIATPMRGPNMTTVEAQWGTPLEKRPPVGDPPITRYVYENLVVFFESDKIIHSVVTIN